MRTSKHRRTEAGQIYSPGSRMLRRFISILLILYTSLTFFVLGVTILNSFKEKTDLATNMYGFPKAFVLTSYGTLFEKGNIFHSFFNSVLISVCGTCLCVFVACAAAYGLSRYRFRGQGALTAYFLVGMMVPMQVTILPLFLILQKIHLLNTRIGMIIMYGSGISFSMYVLAKFFKTVPTALEESAKLDGSNDFITFLLIILPVCKPVIFTMGLITFIGCWNDFYMPMVLLSKQRLHTLTLTIYIYMSQFVRKMDVSFAAVVFTLIPIILLYCLFSRQMVEGLTGGAVKG